MQRFAVTIVLALLACSPGTVDEASGPPATQAHRDAVQAKPSSTETDHDEDPPNASPASSGPPLPLECQAPLQAIEEITRFFTVAATHATTSASCVDGPGQRVRIDEIHICPMAAKKDRRPFAATYRVAIFPEGGRQTCGNECPKVEPQTSRHRIELAFRSAAGGYRLQPIDHVSGLPPDATPPVKAHDGDCYGRSPAYEPAKITLP